MLQFFVRVDQNMLPSSEFSLEHVKSSDIATFSSSDILIGPAGDSKGREKVSGNLLSSRV